MNRSISQAGISMIELLVALLIGSFLVLGVTQIYIDNRQSYAFQQSQSENQENSRYAMLVLQQELEKAGYRRRPDELMDYAFPANTTMAGCAFAKGQTVLWNNASNSLCIRYQPRTNTDRDCLGNLVANVPAQPYTESTAVFIERLYLDGDRLMCASTTNAAPGELIAGVAGLNFEFGVTSDEREPIDRYEAQGNIIDDIVTIRYAALLRSTGGRVRDTNGDSPVLEKWQIISGASDADIDALKGDDAGQLYQISQSTVMLRNLMP